MTQNAETTEAGGTPLSRPPDFHDFFTVLLETAWGVSPICFFPRSDTIHPSQWSRCPADPHTRISLD